MPTHEDSHDLRVGDRVQDRMFGCIGTVVERLDEHPSGPKVRVEWADETTVTSPYGLRAIGQNGDG